GSSLAGPAVRPDCRDPARDASPRGRQHPGGRRRLLAPAPLRPRASCAPGVLTAQGAGHVLRPPLGARPGPAPAPGPGARAAPALRRAGPNRGPPPQAPCRVPLRADRGLPHDDGGGVMTTRPADGDEPVEVVPFDGDPASWDRFVGTTACATFCHLAGWREIMADVLGHECVYAVAVTSAGEWAGALPMVRVRSRLFGDHLVSVPFLNYGGPLGSPAAERALMHWAFDEARRRGVDGLELRVRHPPGGS